MLAREIYEFEEFTLDAAERRLTREAQIVPLAPKAFDVLLALVRNSGRLVTKHELLERIWPDSYVEEGILAVHISGLRKALGSGDGGNGHIETVSRSGYRFTSVVTRQNGEPKTPARLPRVYELFGQGRSYLLACSMFDVPKALAAFRAAIELDPTYAEAHAGLALACCAQAKMRLVPPAEAYSEAKGAALRALAMDPACADAQAALGEVLFLSEWDWVGAERSLRRAIELNPHHTEAYLLYGQLMDAQGKLDQGLAWKQKALEREPDSPLVHLQISMSYWNQRRYDESIEWANKTLALDPRHPHAREHLAGAYWKKGDFDRFLSENLKHAAAHGVPAEALDPVKQAYAAGGPAGVAKLFLKRAAGQPAAFPAFQLAVQYAAVGDLDAAFQHLEKAIALRDPALVHLAVGPQWDSLRADPRFALCLARMGLTPLSEPATARS